MDRESVARTAPPGIPPDPEDHARLLEAAKSALRLLDAMDEHMPADLCFGGEARVRRELRTALRLAAS